MGNLVIDFETRSECDLGKCGAYVYASHPSTTILCMGWMWKGKAYLWKEGEDLPAEFYIATVEADKIVAHNYQFEYWVWNLVGVKKFDFPKLPVWKMDCTMSRALAYALPRKLETLALAIGLGVEKDMKGHRVMLKLSKPRKPTKNNDKKWHDKPEDFQTLYDYCLKDIEVEDLADKILYTLSDQERAVWELDFKINDRGIPIDIDSAIRARDFCNKFIEEQNIRLSEITNGQLYSTGQVAAIVKYCTESGFYMKDLAADTVTKSLMTKEMPNRVREVLKIRQQLAKSSVKKLEAMIHRTADDDRARGGLVYHAATTGRWGGSGIQIQNVPRPTIDNPEECLDFLKVNSYEYFKERYPDVLGAISSCLRYFVCASEGKEFIVSDFSAIEARMLFWLAECSLGLTQFAQGRDIYKEMAGKIVDESYRQLGKQAILGCGFGMGDKKFKETCDGYGMDVPTLLAKKAVKTYRETYRQVPAFWYGVEDAAVKAVRTGQVTQYKKIKYKVVGKYLFCQLPSGRKLSYYEPMLQKTKTPWGVMKDQLTFMGLNSQTRKWVRQTTYGGKLTENITQACARDVMVNSMLNVENTGWPIVFTVHDELVCEVDNGAVSIEEFDKVMSIVPKWASDLPLKVETYISKRYKK